MSRENGTVLDNSTTLRKDNVSIVLKTRDWPKCYADNRGHHYWFDSNYGCVYKSDAYVYTNKK